MSKKHPPVRVSKPPARLSLLVQRPGGLLRDVAIARGEKNLEAQRGRAESATMKLIDTLETMTESLLSVDQLRDCLRTTDQLISLARMFDKEQLAQVGERLCALIATLIAIDEVKPEPIAVHIRALRLFAQPAELPAPVAAHIRTGLDKVLVHFDVQDTQIA